MRKTKAIEVLGGIPAAAEAIGISYWAVAKWPDELPKRISDRVLAVLARRHLSPELLAELGVTEGAIAAAVPKQPPAEPPHDAARPLASAEA